MHANLRSQQVRCCSSRLLRVPLLLPPATIPLPSLPSREGGRAPPLLAQPKVWIEFEIWSLLWDLVIAALFILKYYLFLYATCSWPLVLNDDNFNPMKNLPCYHNDSLQDGSIPVASNPLPDHLIMIKFYLDHLCNIPTHLTHDPLVASNSLSKDTKVKHANWNQAAMNEPILW